MGIPVSAVIANPYKVIFEQQAIESKPCKPKIWKRFILLYLIHAFITSRLDYCNSLLYGVPDYYMQKLQRFMNASARLIFCALASQQ